MADTWFRLMQLWSNESDCVCVFVCICDRRAAFSKPKLRERHQPFTSMWFCAESIDLKLRVPEGHSGIA